VDKKLSTEMLLCKL